MLERGGAQMISEKDRFCRNSKAQIKSLDFILSVVKSLKSFRKQNDLVIHLRIHLTNIL